MEQMPERLSTRELDELVAKIGQLDGERDSAREMLKQQVCRFGWMNRHIRTPLFDIWYRDGKLTIMERDEPQPPNAAAA